MIIDAFHAADADADFSSGNIFLLMLIIFFALMPGIKRHFQTMIFDCRADCISMPKPHFSADAAADYDADCSAEGLIFF